MKTYDIIYICDNNINAFLGGTEASVKIILESQCSVRKVAIIQPGEEGGTNTEYDEYSYSPYIYIKALFKHPWSFIQYILFVRNVLKENSASIIHVQAHVGFFIIGFLIETKLIKKDFKLVYTDRGLYKKYNSFFRKLFVHYMKYADYLVTTTEYNKRHWVNALSGRNLYKKLEYRIIENTAGVRNLQCKDELIEENKPLVIGFAGRYCGWKNWPLAEKICEKVHRKDASIEFRMAVAGNSVKDQLKIKDMFKRLKKSCGNQFEGELNIPFSNMNRFYEKIDIFILTSNHDSESFGRTLVEAMVRKTAVLLTDAGGAVEVVSDPVCVCNGADEFCQRIIEMKNNKKLLKERKEKNYARVKKVYSLENNIEKHMKLYSDIEEEKG